MSDKGPEINDCLHLPERNLWPTRASDAAPVFRKRDPVTVDGDSSTASSFEAWRDLHTARKVEIAACAGTVRLSRVSRTNQLHLTITIRPELSRGVTVGSYIQQFDVDGEQAKVFIMVPKKYRPEIVLEVPNDTDTLVDLGDGALECTTLMSNKIIAIGVGDLILPGDIDGSYKSVRAAFGKGGVRDGRSPGKARTGNAYVWTHRGEGPYSLIANFGSGYLTLLPDGLLDQVRP